MSRARLFGNALRFALLTGVAIAAACSDDPGGDDGDAEGGASGDGPSTGAQPSGGTSGMGTGGSNVGGEPGEGGTTTGGSAGTASGTGGDAGEGGDAGDGGEGANGGTGGAAGSSAGMGGAGAGGAGGGMAGAGMAGGGMAGSGIGGSGMAGAGNGGGGSGNAGGGMGGSGNVGGGGVGGSGNAGGSGATGGTGGAGGSGTVGCGSPSIFDDMEDGDGGICWSNTRQGGWYVGKEDGVGVILPDAGTVVSPSLLTPARGTSTRGMHFQGSGFAGANHFAFIAAAVNAGTNGVPYDASVHTGIRFWAKSDAGGLAINVKFVTVSTTDAIFGGSCVPTTVACSDHWQAPRALTGAWQQYSIYFPNDLSQMGWGVPRPKDLAHLTGIEFYYSSNGNPAAFDFWIDDIEFW